MEISLIGAGFLGACLARKLKDAAHTVRIANSRGPETLADLAKEVGATAVSVVDVAKQSDVLIISVPMKAISNFRPIYSMARAATSSWSTLATTIPCVTDA
jgi:predicted dinucleotide-binding enzyme